MLVRVVLRLGDNPNAISLLRSDADPSEVVQYLSAQLGEQLSAPAAAKATKVLVSPSAEMVLAAEGETWDGLASIALNLVRQRAGDPLIAERALETASNLVPKSKIAQAGIVDLANEGVLAARLQYAFEANNEEVVVNVLALMISTKTTFSPPTDTSWSRLENRISNLPKKLLHRLRELFGPAAIHLVWDSYHATSYQSRGLLSDILNYAVRNRDLGNLYINDIVSNIRYFTKPLEWRLEGEFIDQIENYKTFWQTFESVELAGSAAGFAAIVTKREPAKAAKIQESLVSRIHSVEQSEWAAAVRSDTELFNLAKTLAGQADLNLGASSSLYKALALEAPVVVASNPEHSSRWMGLTNLLSARAKRSVFRIFADELMAGRAGGGLHQLLRNGGQQLLQLADFGRNPDDALGNIVIPLLDTSKGRDWIKDHMKELRTWVGKASEEPRDQLRGCLAKMMRSRNESRRYWAELVNEELKFEN